MMGQRWRRKPSELRFFSLGVKWFSYRCGGVEVGACQTQHAFGACCATRRPDCRPLVGLKVVWGDLGALWWDSRTRPALLGAGCWLR
jgi:hypothetical protein